MLPGGIPWILMFSSLFFYFINRKIIIHVMAEHNNLMKKKYLQQLFHTHLRQPFIYFTSFKIEHVNADVENTLIVIFIVIFI